MLPRETDSSRSATRTLPPVAQHAWYAVWVRSHFEQDVRDQLSAKGFHTFLPELPSWSRRADGRLTFPTPMFPGYLFVREALDKSRYIDLLSVHGVVRILEDGWPRLTPVPDAEIDALQRIVAADVPVHPCAHLRDGMRVRVLDGPLAGIEGLFVQGAPAKGRLVVSVGVLGRSIAVEMDPCDVAPCAAPGARGSTASPVHVRMSDDQHPH